MWKPFDRKRDYTTIARTHGLVTPAPEPDGETEVFYRWVIDQARLRGERPETEHERQVPLRARAFSAAAYLIGAESCEMGAPPPYSMCGSEMFELLRETWASGYRAGGGR